jgi:hypothetical protein
MSYSFDTRPSSKWDTIQSDIADMYIEDLEVEDEDGDIFGFSKSIEIDHLTDEEVDTVLAMFGDNN